MGDVYYMSTVPKNHPDFKDLYLFHGKSAYQSAVQYGYTGTEEEWVEELKHLIFGTLGSFPEESKKDYRIYIDIDSDYLYRYDPVDDKFIQIGMKIGETENDAYRGDRGKIAYDHSQSEHVALDHHHNASDIDDFADQYLDLKTIDIASDTDLNTITMPNFYQASNVTGTLNAPIEDSTRFELRVNKAGEDTLIQYFTGIDNLEWYRIIQLDSNGDFDSEIISWRLSDTVYIHPATHAASIIVQDATHRFVSDDDIAKWNKALDDAKQYTDDQIDALKGNVPADLDTLEKISDALGGDKDFAQSVYDAIDDAKSDLTDLSDDVLDAAKKYTDDSINALAGAAPEVLDTLEEISKALGDDPNFATTITTELTKKANSDDVADDIADALAEAKKYTDDFPIVSTSGKGFAPKVTDTSLFLKGDGTWAKPDTGVGSFYGNCASSGSDVNKVVILVDGDDFKLLTGVIIGVNFTDTNTVNGITLNVNNTGDKPIFYDTSIYAGNSSLITGYAGRRTFYQYDGSNWVWISASIENDTYPTAVCRTDSSNAIKEAECSEFSLLNNSHLVISMTKDNVAQDALTLNVNETGAKYIYINGEISSATNYTLPAGMYFVFYDGSDYYFRTDGKLTTDITGNAASADKATNDAANQEIHKTYIKDITISGTTVTITKGDGNTSTQNTQDSSYTLPVAGTSLGGVKSGGDITVKSDGSVEVNKAKEADKVDWSNIDNKPTSASSTEEWLVPKVAADSSDDEKFLRGDGTWAENPKMNFYGSCTSAGTDAAKEVTLADINFKLVPGCIIGVMFVNTNEASGVTLNVNNTGAKSIWYDDAVYTDDGEIQCGAENRVTYYMYNGTYWVWHGISKGGGDTATVELTNAEYEALTEEEKNLDIIYIITDDYLPGIEPYDEELDENSLNAVQNQAVVRGLASKLDNDSASIKSHTGTSFSLEGSVASCMLVTNWAKPSTPYEIISFGKNLAKTFDPGPDTDFYCTGLIDLNMPLEVGEIYTIEFDIVVASGVPGIMIFGYDLYPFGSVTIDGNGHANLTFEVSDPGWANCNRIQIYNYPAGSASAKSTITNVMLTKGNVLQDYEEYKESKVRITPDTMEPQVLKSFDEVTYVISPSEITVGYATNTAGRIILQMFEKIHKMLNNISFAVDENGVLTATYETED